MANSNREPRVLKTSPERPRRIRADRADEAPAILVEVVAIDDSLSDNERADREQLERIVEGSIFEAGRALGELRDRRLYRDEFPTFEEYCQVRFGHTRQKANFLIAAASVYENLRANGCQIEMEILTTIGCQNDGGELTDDPDSGRTPLTTNGCQNGDETVTTILKLVLPTNERQVRPLAPLSPTEQVKVWTAAVEEAGGKVPPARVVKDIVQRIREKTKVPNPYRIGDVCQILVKENPDLRGRGGAWCIISEVLDYSCIVDMWDGQLQVAIQNLKDLEYSPEQRERVRKCRERLYKLYGFYEDKTVRLMLEAIGKSASPYLSGIEEKLLDFLEAERERESGNDADGSIVEGGAESNGKRERVSRK